MIDGESSKAELLQSSKCSSGDITAVILTLLTLTKSVRFDTEAAAEAGRVYNYTKRAFTGENTLNYQSETEEMRRSSEKRVLIMLIS